AASATDGRARTSSARRRRARGGARPYRDHMTFREGGSFEGGRVRTRRGGVAAGGGIGLAIVAFLVYQLTGVDLSGELASLQQVTGAGAGGGQVGEVPEC